MSKKTSDNNTQNVLESIDKKMDTLVEAVGFIRQQTQKEPKKSEYMANIQMGN